MSFNAKLTNLLKTNPNFIDDEVYKSRGEKCSEIVTNQTH